MSRPTLELSDCEILSLFNEHQTLTNLSTMLKMDKGQLSRKLNKIAASAPVLSKVQGKWTLTNTGLQIIEWYKKVIEEQNTILNGIDELVLCTTQTISDRIVGNMFPKIMEATGLKKLHVVTDTSRVEADLLSGKFDVALVCSIPENPEIRYKRIFKSSFVIVTPASWKENFQNLDSLFKAPYVTHSGIDVRGLLGVEEAIPDAALKFDHLSGVRQGVVSGAGWAVLPMYAVEKEIKEKKLKVFTKHSCALTFEEFQLWWVPGKMDKKMAMKLVSIFQ